MNARRHCVFFHYSLGHSGYFVETLQLVVSCEAVTISLLCLVDHETASSRF